jgi:hypothetical protein
MNHPHIGAEVKAVDNAKRISAEACRQLDNA